MSVLGHVSQRRESVSPSWIQGVVVKHLDVSEAEGVLFHLAAGKIIARGGSVVVGHQVALAVVGVVEGVSTSATRTKGQRVTSLEKRRTVDGFSSSPALDDRCGWPVVRQISVVANPTAGVRGWRLDD